MKEGLEVRREGVVKWSVMAGSLECKGMSDEDYGGVTRGLEAVHGRKRMKDGDTSEGMKT